MRVAVECPTCGGQVSGVRFAPGDLEARLDGWRMAATAIVEPCGHQPEVTPVRC